MIVTYLKHWQRSLIIVLLSNEKIRGTLMKKRYLKANLLSVLML